MTLQPFRLALAALSLVGVVLAGCSGGGSGGASGLQDPDRDGLPNALESFLGSDPSDPDDPYLEGDQDDDTREGPGPDALPDGLERYLLSGGSTAPILARTDRDGDGLPDYIEVASGSDPSDRNAPLRGGGNDRDDPDGPSFDGVTDALEAWLLARGAPPPLTPRTDTDRDGIPDVYEVRSGSSPFDPLDPPYDRAFDLDHDQVPDWIELRDGTDLLVADTPTFDGADDDDGGVLGPDGDGISDGLEGWLVQKGVPAPITLATDTDADGLPDAIEVRAGTDPFDPASPLHDGAVDGDGNGIPDGVERVLRTKGIRAPTPTSDADRDSVGDVAELLSGSNPFDPSDPTLFSHWDLDGDGIEDFLELGLGSDRLDPDSPLAGGALDRDDTTGPPQDPLSDAMEALLIARGTAAPVTTYSDSDGDGVPDFVELRWVSDPFDPDSPVPQGNLDTDDAGGPSGDGLTDAAEQVLIALGAAGPQDPARNSDRDVIPDAIELITGTNWLDSASPRPNRGADADGDGALDWLELVLGFDPLSADDPVPGGGADGDGDGLSDALEELLRLTSTPEPISPTSDSDGDGLADHLEILLASDRHDPDSPVHAGGLDVVDRTGPSGDGISDALEAYLVRSGAVPPVTTRSDSDGDELPDYLELRLALDAFDPDSPLPNGRADDDDDGVSNAMELVLERLGATPPIDGRTDSDGDGAPDHLEVFAGANAFDPDDPLVGGGADADGDGLSDALENVLIALGASPPVGTTSDTDGDGIPDLYEILSSTHPLRADHPLPGGGADVDDTTGPVDTISDALESLLISQGASAPVTREDDTDRDGAPDHLEVFAGALPYTSDDPVLGGEADSDGDGLTDALEETLVRLGAPAPVDTRTESDGDGAPDFFEVQTGAHPRDPNVPVLDGAGAGFDVVAETGPNGDGLSDAFELLLIQIGCDFPVGTGTDTDHDGLPDHFEARSGTNPLDGDSPLEGGGRDSDDSTGPPGDLITDALEAFLIAHGTPGPITLDTDSDGDGVPDFYEIFKGSDPFDGSSAIEPGTRPRAEDPAFTGIFFDGRLLTGTYRYADDELDPEGETSFRWLRDGVPIPGATETRYRIVGADVGHDVSFEIVPASLYAYPPETRIGVPARATHTIPVPSFPRGTGGPGGVGVADGTGDVRLWLRADEGLETSAGKIVQWDDLSGWGRNAKTVTAATRPVLVEGVGPLAVPAVHFEGAQHLSVPRPVEDSFTLVAVFATRSLVSDPSWYLSPAILGGETPPPCSMDYHLGINGGKPLFVVQDVTLTTSVSFANGQPRLMMATRAITTGSMKLYMDGRSRGSANSSTASLTCPIDLFVGSSTARDGFWTGDLLEVCAFDGVLSNVARTLVENDYAARLGTSASAPRYDFGATHGGDVAGIGRESVNDVIDSAEGAGILRISAPSALSDGDYLMWGTDLPRDFSFSQDVPPPYPQRLARTWTWQVTDGGNGDGVGKVDLRFRLKGLFLSGDPDDSALLFDDDGTFSNARVHVGTTVYDPVLETIEFRGVQLGPERYFTLAVTPL